MCQQSPLKLSGNIVPVIQRSQHVSARAGCAGKRQLTCSSRPGNTLQCCQPVTFCSQQVLILFCVCEGFVYVKEVRSAPALNNWQATPCTVGNMQLCSSIFVRVACLTAAHEAAFTTQYRRSNDVFAACAGWSCWRTMTCCTWLAAATASTTLHRQMSRQPCPGGCSCWIWRSTLS